jgi:hypothetical protein
MRTSAHGDSGSSSPQTYILTLLAGRTLQPSINDPDDYRAIYGLRHVHKLYRTCHRLKCFFKMSHLLLSKHEARRSKEYIHTHLYPSRSAATFLVAREKLSFSSCDDSRRFNQIRLDGGRQGPGRYDRFRVFYACHRPSLPAQAVLPPKRGRCVVVPDGYFP